MSIGTEDLCRLLEQVSRGNRDSFAAIYRATHLKLFGIIFRILRRQALAEEILQEVYIRIWERAGDYRPEIAAPITWMSTIARNRALDEVRKRGLDAVSDDAAAMEIPDPQKSPADFVELSEQLRRLEECLDGLDGDRREAIKLAYLDGYSRKELAERYGQPVGTIKTWLHRGLKQLKDCLGS